MLYCDECAKKRGYPVNETETVGMCEICGDVALCNSEIVKKFNDDVLRTKRVAVIIIDDCNKCPEWIGCKHRIDNGISNNCPLNSEEVPYSNSFDNPERQTCILNYSEKNEINKKYGIKR